MSIQDYADNIETFLKEKVGDLSTGLIVPEQGTNQIPQAPQKKSYPSATIAQVIALYEFKKNHDLQKLILSALQKANQFYRESEEKSSHAADFIVKHCALLVVMAAYLSSFSFLLHPNNESRTTEIYFRVAIAGGNEPFTKNSVDMPWLGRYLANIRTLAHVIAASCETKQVFKFSFDEHHTNNMLKSLNDFFTKHSPTSSDKIALESLLDYFLFLTFEVSYQLNSASVEGIENPDIIYKITKDDLMEEPFNSLVSAYNNRDDYRILDSKVLEVIEEFFACTISYILPDADEKPISMKIFPLVSILEMAIFLNEHKNDNLLSESVAIASSSQAASSNAQASSSNVQSNLRQELLAANGSRPTLNSSSITNMDSLALEQATQACKQLIRELEMFTTATGNSPTFASSSYTPLTQLELSESQSTSIAQSLAAHVPVILRGLISQATTIIGQGQIQELISANAKKYASPHAKPTDEPLMSLQYAQLLFAASLILSAKFGRTHTELSPPTTAFSFDKILSFTSSLFANPAPQTKTIEILGNFLINNIEKLLCFQEDTISLPIPTPFGNLFGNAFNDSMIGDLVKLLKEQWISMNQCVNSASTSETSRILTHLLIKFSFELVEEKISLTPMTGKITRFFNSQEGLNPAPASIEQENQKLIKKVAASTLPETTKNLFNAIIEGITGTTVSPIYRPKSI